MLSKRAAAAFGDALLRAIGRARVIEEFERDWIRKNRQAHDATLAEMKGVAEEMTLRPGEPQPLKQFLRTV